MSTGQREDSQVMVEGGWLPGSGRMTGATTGAIFAAMMIVLCMAGITILRGAFQDTVFMAARTIHAEMCAGQLEGRDIMVERGWFPRRRRVAYCTVRPQVAAVRVGPFMA